MPTTITQFRRDNPGYSIGGEGRWLVIWHRGRATRYASYFDAQRESVGDCGFCDGKQPHAIVELAEEAPRFQTSRSFRRMVAAND